MYVGVILVIVVFPMYVGVIQNVVGADRNALGIPHVCGGDPEIHVCKQHVNSYSPCMWG